MSLANEKIIWSKRVSQRKIRLLYENDAKGIIDEELIDDIAFKFFIRCQDIITVTDASRGKLKCIKCGNIIYHNRRKDEFLKCEKCFWQITWGSFLKSCHRNQLHGVGALNAFKNYVIKLPKIKTPEGKMILIDQLIHEVHQWTDSKFKEPIITRPVAVNIIEGSTRKVILFLDRLSRSNQRKISYKKFTEKVHSSNNYILESKRRLKKLD